MLNDILTTYFNEFKNFFTNYPTELALLFVSVLIIMIFRFVFRTKKGN